VVPRGARVVVDAEVGAGTMRILDGERLDGTDLADTRASDPAAGVPDSGTTITIDAEVGLGDLEVQR
jgi:hypothetical protein